MAITHFKTELKSLSLSMQASTRAVIRYEKPFRLIPTHLVLNSKRTLTQDKGRGGNGGKRLEGREIKKSEIKITIWGEGSQSQ